MFDVGFILWIWWNWNSVKSLIWWTSCMWTPSNSFNKQICAKDASIYTKESEHVYDTTMSYSWTVRIFTRRTNWISPLTRCSFNRIILFTQFFLQVCTNIFFRIELAEYCHTHIFFKWNSCTAYHQFPLCHHFPFCFKFLVRYFIFYLYHWGFPLFLINEIS